jgi:hypothetical protein
MGEVFGDELVFAGEGVVQRTFGDACVGDDPVDADGIYLAVASAGGALKNPSWYANLIAHPDVLVQDRGR